MPRWIAFLCVLLSVWCSAQQSGFKPAAPDPLFQNRVEGSITAVSLHLRLASGPTGLVAWELLKESRNLSEAQLRTLMLDLMRLRRGGASEAESLAMETYADRNPEAAAAAVMRISDWEDSIPEIGDYDSDVESFGRKLWMRVALTDLGAALRLADGLTGAETRGRMLEYGEDRNLTPAYAVLSVLETAGRETARASVERIPAGPQRRTAEAVLADAADPPRISSPVVSENPVLARLTALDDTSEFPGRSPFPLLREVLQLSPDQALELAREMQKAGPQSGWLSWMLFHRAAEGDPRKAEAVAVTAWRVATVPLAQSIASLWAMRASQPGIREEIRAMLAGERREAAAAGYFSRADMSAADELIAMARELPVSASAATPLLVRLACSGRGPDAMRLAAGLSENGLQWSSVSAGSEIMKAWCLTDLPAAIRYLESRLAEPRFCESIRWGMAEVFGILPASQLLGTIAPTTLAKLRDHEMIFEEFWLYLATEDIEAGFRFFERTAGDEGFARARESFASVAAHYQPERAKALLDPGTAPIDGKEAAPR